MCPSLNHLYRCSECSYESLTHNDFIYIEDKDKVQCPNCDEVLDIIHQPFDCNGRMIINGATVSYGEGTSTSVGFSGSRGGPFVKVTLANGMVFNAHFLEVVE